MQFSVSLVDLPVVLYGYTGYMPRTDLLPSLELKNTHTVEPLILATLNFGIWVNVIILDPVILAFLLAITLKRYCIQIFVARYFRELARLVKFAK